MCAAMQLFDFVLADKPCSGGQFFNLFTDPCLVRIVQVAGDFSLSAPQFARNAQFWVFDKHRQRRLLFRSQNNRYLSISMDSPAKFHIVYRHAAGPSTTLKELFKNSRNISDIKIALDDDPDLMLSNRPDLNNAVAYGELTAVAMMEETCLVSQSMNGSALESRLTLISTRAPLVLDSVVGIRQRSSSYFREWTDALRQQQIQPSPALLSAPSFSDIVLLCDIANRQHSSLLYIVREDSKGANIDQLSQVTTHLESNDVIVGATVHSASSMEQKAPNKRQDVESIRKKFENSSPCCWDSGRNTQREAQTLPARTLSDRIAELPPSISSIRTEKKSRPLSQDFLRNDCHPTSVEGTPICRTHTRSMENVLDIGDESCSLPDHPPSIAGHDWTHEDNGGYDSIKELSEQCQSLLLCSTDSKTKNATDFAAVAGAKNKVSKPPLPNRRTPPDTPSKPKLGPRLRWKKDKSPKTPGPLYEGIKRGPTDDHYYAQLADFGACSVDSKRHRKWKSASEIPRDVDVASLTVNEVAHCLELLKLRKYARKFKERVVDGAVLVTVTDSMLVESFKMDKIDARKLVMFARDNWRPSK